MLTWSIILVVLFFICMLFVVYKARKEVKQFEELQNPEEQKCNVSTTCTNKNNKDKTNKSVTLTYADGKSFKVTPKKSSYSCKPCISNNYHHNHIDSSPDLLTTLVAAEIIEDAIEDHYEDNHCDYNDCSCQNDNNYENNYSSNDDSCDSYSSSGSDYGSSYDSGDSYSSYDSSSSYDSGSCGSSDW